MYPLLDIHFVTSSIEKSSAAQQLPPGRQASTMAGKLRQYLQKGDGVKGTEKNGNSRNSDHKNRNRKKTLG